MPQEVMPQDQVSELEIIPKSVGEVQINQSKLDSIIKFAEQSEKLGKALDTTRRFMLNRAYPGDFVLFGDKLSLSGPGAERMISALALMGVEVAFKNWKSWKDDGEDKNGKWFTWFYQADVFIGGLEVEGIQGRAGSRDLFFGFASGQWKDLGDVKESDIRMAARRGVIKEGIQLALGMRALPADDGFLASIGLDPKKIKKVSFGSGKQGTAVSGAQDEFIAKVVKVTIKREQKAEGDKKGYKIVAVAFNNNVTAETFDEKVATKAKELMQAGADVFARTSAAKDPKYAPKLEEIMTATEDHKKQLAPKDAAPPKDAGADGPGDAQE